MGNIGDIGEPGQNEAAMTFLDQLEWYEQGPCRCLPPALGVPDTGRAYCPVHDNAVFRGHGPGCGCRDCENTRLRAALTLIWTELLRHNEEAVIRTMGVPPPDTRITERTTRRHQWPAVYPPPPEPEPGRERNTALILTVCGMIFALAVISQVLFWFH